LNLQAKKKQAEYNTTLKQLQAELAAVKAAGAAAGADAASAEAAAAGANLLADGGSDKAGGTNRQVQQLKQKLAEAAADKAEAGE
jgi:hypothetical protein